MEGGLDDQLLDTRYTNGDRMAEHSFRMDSPALFSQSRSGSLNGEPSGASYMVQRDTMTTPSAEYRLTVLPGGGGALLAINVSGGTAVPGKSGASSSHRGSTSSLSAVFLLMNAILGSGILGYAYAMRSSGALLFCVFLLGMSLAAHYAVVLLTRACEAAQVVSYEQLGEVAMGYKGKLIATITIMMQNTGALIGYVVILGDLVPPLVQQISGNSGGHHHYHHHDSDETPFIQRRWVLMALVVLVVDLPLASLKDIGMLGYCSGASIFIMVFFAVLYAVEAIRFYSHGESMCDPGEAAGEGCDFKLANVDAQTAITFPTLAFSFVCHTALLPIYTELQDRRPAAMQRISMIAMISCMCLYFTAALAGYASFRGSVLPDSLESLEAAESKNRAVLVLRILVCVSIAVTVPLINFPFRRAATLLLFPDQEFSWVRHVGIAMVTLTVVTTVAIFLPGIRTVFGLVGATTSVTLVFVLPSLFFEFVYVDVVEYLRGVIEASKRQLADAPLGGKGSPGLGVTSAWGERDGSVRPRVSAGGQVYMTMTSPTHGPLSSSSSSFGPTGSLDLDNNGDGLLSGTSAYDYIYANNSSGQDAAAAGVVDVEGLAELESRLWWIELHRIGARCMIGGGVLVGVVSLSGIIYGWTAYGRRGMSALYKLLCLASVTLFFFFFFNMKFISCQW